jgi:hypothetical protein
MKAVLHREKEKVAMQERERIEAQERQREELRMKQAEMQTLKNSRQTRVYEDIPQPPTNHPPVREPEPHFARPNVYNYYSREHPLPYGPSGYSWNEFNSNFQDQPPPLWAPVSSIPVVAEIWIPNQWIRVSFHLPMCFDSSDAFDETFKEFKRRCVDQMMPGRAFRIEGFISNGYELIHTMSDLLRCCHRDEFQRSNLCRLQALCVMD